MLALLLGFAVMPAAELEQVHAGPAGAAAVGPDFYVVADPSPSWLTSVDIGLPAFGGGMSHGTDFFWGSTIPASAAVEVEIRITPGETTFAQTYRRDRDFADGGVGLFPGSVWDITDPNNHRRLNIIFVEDSTTARPANQIWDPDANEAIFGGREYLLIMNSDYDGNGLSYIGQDGLSADVLYGWWPLLKVGRIFFKTDPHTLTMKLARVSHLTILAEADRLNLFWDYAPENANSFVIYGGQAPNPQTVIAEVPVATRSYIDTGLSPGVPYYYRLEAQAANHTVRDISLESSSVPTPTSHRLNLEGLWNGRRDYGDVWGYTAPGGAEYALLNVRGAGLSIIDINGDRPVEIGFAAALADGYPDAKDVKVYDHYAILVNENAPAQVIDLADPANPLTVATIFVGDPAGNGGAHNAFVEGRYLYITGGHGNQQGVHIYDLADPENPLLLGGRHNYYYHDFYVRNDTAYASAGSRGVDVLDLADKSNPVWIGNISYAGQWAHNSWTTDDGNYLVVGDENGFSGQWTRVFDIRDLSNPVKVADIIVDAAATVHNSYVAGDYLYIAHYTEGLRIWDISDPTQPVEAAYFDTYLPNDSRFGGVWSVYPYFASGKIVVSDRSSGLIVFTADATLDVDPPAPGVPQLFYLAQNYPNPFNLASVITYGLPRDSEISLKIYDILGLEVAILAQGRQSAGRHRITWNADGSPSGIYFARLVTADGQRQTIKLTLIK